ncbi:MAG: polyprenyl synthetase family protein [Planctomycetaceae bacterium]|nr:polyprenyl synthetase family protein [Planctomycetaceae bacterium]
MPRLEHASELLTWVEREIGLQLLETERTFEAELESANPFVADIIAHTRKFRGKRLRPILLLLAGKAAGGLTTSHPVLAAVVEMIHTATLVHDDVLDVADVRRHVATVNVRWNNETSVLYGDYLFTHAFHLAASLETTEACRVIGRATNRVCEGELTQVRHRGDLFLNESTYFEIIDGKTAELCAVACWLGGRYAQAEDRQIAALEQYGRNLGLAFQIADDVLDLTGTEEAVGKTLGTDLSQQKLTLPIIRLLHQLSGSSARDLRQQIQDEGEQAAPEVMRLCREEGVLDSTLKTAQDLAQEATSLLNILPASPARQLLQQLPRVAVDRSC